MWIRFLNNQLAKISPKQQNMASIILYFILYTLLIDLLQLPNGAIIFIKSL